MKKVMMKAMKKVMKKFKERILRQTRRHEAATHEEAKRMSLYRDLFDHRLKTLETDFSEFKQMNQFAKAVSSIPGIVDAYLANKMHEAIKTDVQLQSKRLRDEAQAENKDFLNKLDDNIKKIIKDQFKEQVKAQVSKILPKIEKTVNEQLKTEVMTRSSTESKTSLAIATNLSELELKKILIDKMEGNKLIRRSDEQNNLYKALVEAYESDKLILYTYVILSRLKDEEMMRIKTKNPPLDQTGGPTEDELEKNLSQPVHQRKSHPVNKGSKSLHKSAWAESAHADEPMHTAKIGGGGGGGNLEGNAHQEKPTRLPSPNHDWKKTLPADLGPVQPWLSNLAREEGPRESFDELMDTPLDSWLFIDESDQSVESYQKKLNIKKPDTYRSDLKRRDAYTAYSNPRGFIYHNKDKKNKLMCIDELHKFSDSTLDDVRTVLNDHLKGIRIEYLPQTIWRQSDRE
ncbi:hypothetical protein Tco_0429008 [Tanacetum coccineum]